MLAYQINFNTLNNTSKETLDTIIALWSIKEGTIERTGLRNFKIKNGIVNNIYQLDKIAKTSLKNVIQLYGAGFDALEQTTRETVINELMAKRIEKDQSVKIVAEKNVIKGVFTAKYQFQPIYTLLNTLKDILQQKKISQCYVERSNLDLAYFYIVLTFPEIQKQYEEQYKIEGIPGLLFRTSEAGLYATQVLPCVISSKTIYIYPEMVKSKHIGEINSISNVKKQFENIFVLLDEQYKKMAKQKNIPINEKFVISTVNKICRFLKLSKKKTKEIKQYVMVEMNKYKISNLLDVTTSIIKYFDLYDLEDKILAGKILNVDENVLKD